MILNTDLKPWLLECTQYCCPRSFSFKVLQQLIALLGDDIAQEI